MWARQWTILARVRVSQLKNGHSADSLIAGTLSDSMASTLTPSYSVKSERIDSDDTGTVLGGDVRAT